MVVNHNRKFIMKTKTLKYKGFIGSVVDMGRYYTGIVSLSHGEKGTYAGTTLAELQRNFRNVVKDYLREKELEEEEYD